MNNACFVSYRNENVMLGPGRLVNWASTGVGLPLNFNTEDMKGSRRKTIMRFARSA
jgi:hypothetical protein